MFENQWDEQYCLMWLLPTKCIVPRNGNPPAWRQKNIPKHIFNQSLYSCFKSKWWVMVRTMNPLCEINTDDLVFNVPIPLIKFQSMYFGHIVKLFIQSNWLKPKWSWWSLGNRSNFWTIKKSDVEFPRNIINVNGSNKQIQLSWKLHLYYT